MVMKSNLYEKDFFAWSNEQASLLRAGKLAQADITHIAEEIESMGKTEKRELISRLRVLLLNLLKWKHQPMHRTASWQNSIRTQRLDISDHLDDNPSLKSQMDDVMKRAYRGARLEASAQTGLPERTFPAKCPWDFAEIMKAGFWPE